MIGLMDCNNFFVSCERLFRPDLLGKPVAVLSSNDGCIVARSQEVKDMGISMGTPFFQIKDICKRHNITLFSSNFSLYRDISARVMQALKAEFDTCEVYSIDEAFFAIDGAVRQEEIAQVRARIIQKTGIPVSIGVAQTKTLSKVANGIAKKRKVGHPMSNFEGVCILDSELWGETQKELSCGSIWGIGRQISALLTRHQIYMVADFLKQDPSYIKQLLGIHGERLLLELSGTSVFALGELVDEDQKSYTSTRSFSKPVKDKTVLLSALGYHVEHIAQKLRKEGRAALRMSIIVAGSRFGDFALRNGSASVDFLAPTNDTFLLIQEASKLLNALYDSEIPYKKAGVIVSNVVSVEYMSRSLFSPSKQSENSERINDVTDALNKKFGTGAVRSGVTLNTEKWQSSSSLLSREYTTNWDEISVVKAK